MLNGEFKPALAPLAALKFSPIGQQGSFASNGRLLPLKDIGFVGLGRMGTAMAANLAAAGAHVIGFTRHGDQIDKLEALGLKPTTDVTKLFECQVVITMLPDDAAA
ncbi:MAG TPA: NAD(P)-binding domain-containing protein, partial [Pirellulales bacterium]